MKKILLIFMVLITIFTISCSNSILSPSVIENVIYTYRINFELIGATEPVADQLGYSTITIESGDSENTITCYPYASESSIAIDSLGALIESSIVQGFTSYGELAFPVSGIDYEATTVTVVDPYDGVATADYSDVDASQTTATITLKSKDNYIFQAGRNTFTITLDLVGVVIDADSGTRATFVSETTTK